MTDLEHAVSDPTQRYRRLVELSPDGIVVSEDGRIVLVNPAAVRLAGAENHATLLGRPLLDLFAGDSRGRVRDELSRLLAGQTVPPLDDRLLRIDGRHVDVEITGAVLEEGGQRALQVILRDVTERKRTEAALRESEERLTLAFAGAQEGVWDWNLETGGVVYSPRWKEMLGYAADEIEPHVSAWERLLHRDDRKSADEMHAQVMRGERMYEGEFRLRHREGHYIHVLSRGFPVRRDAGGPVVRIVGTHFDLTERRKAEAERIRTDLLARLVFAQEDERRRIAREMHDQFGEQLTALEHGIARLEEACVEVPGLAGAVAALAAIAQRLDRDVEQLVWELRPTALDDLGLRAALANYVQDWSARLCIDAQLHTSGLMDERLAPEVETALYRIAQEALTNVAKHASARHVEVILERRPDHVLLVIEDDGVGFDPSDMKAAPSGFGLLGMQERAALIGATLEIEAAAGKGSTILVRMTAVPRRDGNSRHD
jgi:PAS domain S-box-containing protein